MAYDMDEDICKIVRSIFIARANEGTTLTELFDIYLSICGELPDIFLQNENSEVRKFLLNMSDVWFEVRDGTHFWFSASERTAHMTKLVANQKVKSSGGRKKRKTPRSTFSNEILKNKQTPLTNDRNCFFKDNYEFDAKQLQLMTRRAVERPPTQKRPMSTGSSVGTVSTSNSNNSFETLYSDGVNGNRNGFFYEYQLMGDDHFMTLASAEFNCKYEFKRVNKGQRQIKVQSVGLCVSGQTIKAATERIQSDRYFVDKKLIVNLGSVDILHGRDLIDMQYDYSQLVRALNSRQIRPIITTLAPIANCGYTLEQRQKFERFNAFLMTSFDNVIDMSKCFLTSNNQTIFDLYKFEPTRVSGSSQPHLLWNKIGRTVVVNFLKRAVINCHYKHNLHGHILSQNLCENNFYIPVGL